MYKNLSIKLKITLAYIILILTSLFSVWYIYNQVDNIALPRKTMVTETNRIFQFSDIFTDMFASESAGRIAMLSTSKKDADLYYKLMDSIHNKIEVLKENIQNPMIYQKLDSVQLLLDRKEKSLNEIIDFRKKYINNKDFDMAIQQIQKAKDDIAQNELVTKDTVQKKDGFFSRVKNVFVSNEEEKQREAKEREELIQDYHSKQKDSIAKAAENIFNKAVQSKSRQAEQFYIKEAELIQNNQVITQSIRDLFSEIEQSVIVRSNESIDHSKAVIDETAINLAWLGGVSIFLVILLGGIVINDLNKNSKYKRELERLNINMEDLIKQKTYFFASITHDIAAPLNTLFGFTDLLSRRTNDKKSKEYLHHMINAARYIQNLVNDLVDFSKLEHNKLKLIKDSFHFKQLLEQVIHPLKEIADKKGIYLISDIAPELDGYVYSDKHRLMQILTNILTNAIKFTHKGGVTLSALKKGSNIEIKIKDSGIGIDKKFHDSIFNEFQQAHVGIEKVYGGTGLGLNITKRLVEMLGGKIYFESELENGTTFFIQLPYDRGEESIGLDLDVVFDNDKKLINKSILVIDDDPMQLKLMREVFKNIVKNIDTLNNGNELKSLLSTNYYDIIFSDIQMPNYSGYSIIRDIRKSEKFLKTPVIAFTGKTDLDEKEYLKLGFNALLRKPIEVNKLLKIVHNTLQINSVMEKETKKNMRKREDTNHLGYDVSELLVFTENDEEAAKEIIATFVSTTNTSLNVLEEALKEYDVEQISEIAHRILPMFRQLKIKVLIPKIEKLEKQTNLFSNNDELELFTLDLVKLIREKLDVISKNEL